MDEILEIFPYIDQPSDSVIFQRNYGIIACINIYRVYIIQNNFLCIGKVPPTSVGLAVVVYAALRCLRRQNSVIPKKR